MKGNNQLQIAVQTRTAHVPTMKQWTGQLHEPAQLPIYRAEPAAARDKIYTRLQSGCLLFCWGQLQNPQIQLAADTVKAEELIHRAT